MDQAGFWYEDYHKGHLLAINVGLDLLIKNDIGAVLDLKLSNC